MRVGNLAAVARSPGPSFRPSIPREIIITPSSPRKPDSRRTDGTDQGHHANARSRVDVPSGVSPTSRSHGHLINDLTRARLLQNAALSHAPIQNDRGLGLGRPLTFDHDRSDTRLRPGLLTPTPILAHRSASLPVPDRGEVIPQPGSLQNRNVSFTTNGIAQDLSSLDDTHLANPSDRPAGNKTIRKTRSLSDIISRNRKPLSEPDRQNQRPLFTWSASKPTELVQASAEPVPLTVARKKGNNLLKTAAEFLQFRKPRRTSSTEAEKNGVSTPSPSDTEQQDIGTVEVAVTANSAAVSRGSLGGRADDIRTASQVCSPSGSITESRSASEDPSDTVGLAFSTSPERTHSNHQEGWSDQASTASQDPIEENGDLQGAKLNLPPPTFGAAEISSRLDESLSGHDCGKSNPALRSKSGMTTPVNWVFKRPQLVPRAQSANSVPGGSSSHTSETDLSDPHSSRSRRNGDSLSRSNTIKAAITGTARPSSTASVPSESPSTSHPRHDSFDGLGFEPSQPISILRADLPYQPPFSHSALGSPSVSFGGETPRISISSSSSRADSAINQTRSRRYTSTSQENVIHSLPFHGVKSSRPRSSTLFSSAPVWLAPISGAAPDKKRASLMRRLSGGLIGNSDTNERRQSQRTFSQDQIAPELESTSDTGQDNTLSPASKATSCEPGETTQEWMARISEVVDRPKMAAFLASK